jgi:hypothetical protein
MEIGVSMVRYDREAPELSILFLASNGFFQGGIRLDFDIGDLKRIGKTLSSLPDKIPGECSYCIGS